MATGARAASSQAPGAYTKRPSGVRANGFGKCSAAGKPGKCSRARSMDGFDNSATSCHDREKKQENIQWPLTENRQMLHVNHIEPPKLVKACDHDRNTTAKSSKRSKNCAMYAGGPLSKIEKSTSPCSSSGTLRSNEYSKACDLPRIMYKCCVYNRQPKSIEACLDLSYGPRLWLSSLVHCYMCLLTMEPKETAHASPPRTKYLCGAAAREKYLDWAPNAKYQGGSDQCSHHHAPAARVRHVFYLSEATYKHSRLQTRHVTRLRISCPHLRRTTTPPTSIRIVTEAGK